MSTPTISSPLLSQSLSGLNGTQTPGGAPQGGTRVHKAAQQFEALLIGEMMKSVREGGEGGWLGSGEETGDDTAVGLAESQFSQAMASGKGLGLASVIEQKVSQQQDGENQHAPQLPTAPR